MASAAEALVDPRPLPDRCVYVYGLVDSSIDPRLLARASGAGDLDVTALGPVAAVHAWIDPAQLQDLEPNVDEGSRLTDLVRRHDGVVTALAGAGPVLPVRLGTLLPDCDTLRRVLADCAADIAEGLERVRGRAEWNLRVLAPSSHPGPAEVAASSTTTGTEYLLGRRDARRRAADLRDEVAAAVEALDSCLADLADEAVGDHPSGTALSRAYLVPTAIQEAFVAAGEQGISELEPLGCIAALRGPLPAYSFADVRLEAHPR